MDSNICMNVSCGVTTTQAWRRGWPLSSGGFADLCDNCGSLFERAMFCNTFHAEESGWRECLLCNKRLHCGCVASTFLLELLDYGGVECIDCARSTRLDTVNTTRVRKDAIHGKFSSSVRDHISDLSSNIVPRMEPRKDVPVFSRPKLTPCRKIKSVCEPSVPTLSMKDNGNGHLGRSKLDEKFDSYREMCRDFTDQSQISVGPINFPKLDSTSRPLSIKEMCPDPQLMSHPWSAPTWSQSFVSPVTDYVPDGRDAIILAAHDPEPNAVKPVMLCLPTMPDSSKALSPQARVARPPAEGRGRNQLLPRYWPRITDQELQQLSGDLNSTIVPLFEKVLSASDAGRVGRLVLPKACAEAYFPPISNSEGLPLKIQDVKGKEWTFQFRYWPNNNSRMYVLEGVTPCIQSMQLQAGDTVTFSRINPGGKLVMGFRKATSYSNIQDVQGSIGPASDLSGDSGFQGDVNDVINQIGCGNVTQIKRENSGGNASNKMLPKPVSNGEKKKSRNISSKSKRLLMHSEEAMELRVTWEEAQDLLRPPPSVTPSIVVIDGQEFEEYDEPPVFGKRTLFISGSSGKQEQWAQCDNCSKWRRIPVDVFLPPSWTCFQNVWDSKRNACSVPEQIRTRESSGRDAKKLKSAANVKTLQEQEVSGLDALASVAVLGETAENTGDPCMGLTTTKHPRHRSGCTCIVCIQPPSGQGKHESTCTCNVCMTVKRRFKTLMLRRRIRQSEREAEIPDTKPEEIELVMNSMTGDPILDLNHARMDRSDGRAEMTGLTSVIDLNCDPTREDHGRPGEAEMGGDGGGGSMMGLVHAASLPLQMYMKQNGFTSLMHQQQEVMDALYLHDETHNT